jgi:hypothetical protein
MSVQPTNLCMGPFEWDDTETIHESIPFFQINIDNTKHVLNASGDMTTENRLLKQSSYYKPIKPHQTSSQMSNPISDQMSNQTSDQTSDQMNHEGIEDFFKQFNVIKVLGKGAFGTAYLCEHISSKESVVLKIPNSNVKEQAFTNQSLSELVRYGSCTDWIKNSLVKEAQFGQLLIEGFYAYTHFPPGVPYSIHEFDYLSTIGIEKEQMQVHPGKPFCMLHSDDTIF